MKALTRRNLLKAGVRALGRFLSAAAQDEGGLVSIPRADVSDTRAFLHDTD
jgi:hypothetical protein